MGVIENHASMTIKQHSRMRELEYALEDLLTADSDGLLIVISFGQESQPEFVAPPPAERAVVLPPPTHPVYVTEKSIIIQETK
ncbi:hypothetical protein NECAME_17551 [Necator americanus]|nr:hypothetical protein NECAME_17551 [Necator americanus]ETN83194.1 hypothetical protein NECAME_17551 [Necator americanus]